MPTLARPIKGHIASSEDGVALHDRLAAGWGARYARGGFARRARFVAQEVLAAIPVDGDWLDAGCGAGDFTRMLAERGASARGVDGSEAMVAAARSAHPVLEFEQERVERLAAPSAYDGVVCLSVLEYVDDPDAVLARLAAALKPGGQLVLSVPNRASLVRAGQRLSRRVTGRGFAYLASSRHAWSREELEAMLTGRGLEVEALRPFDPVLPRPLWVASSLWFATARKAAS